MKPWVYADDDGDELIISEASREGQAFVRTPGSNPVFVSALDIPEITGKLWEACGQAAPVMLGRPDIPLGTAADPAPIAGFDVWRENGRVYAADVQKGGNGLDPNAARMLAAVIVMHADAADIPEPDPAEVDELAAVLMDGTGAMGLGGARPLARRILAAGYRREAGT